jgi:hypothetical protein
MPSFGKLRRLATLRTDVSEELSASIIRVTRLGELGTLLNIPEDRILDMLLFLLSAWRGLIVQPCRDGHLAAGWSQMLEDSLHPVTSTCEPLPLNDVKWYQLAPCPGSVALYPALHVHCIRRDVIFSH